MQNKKSMKKNKTSILLNTNIIFTVAILILNLISYTVSAANKELFIIFSIFINCLTFAVYRIVIAELYNKYWLELKKELFYINYPLTIVLITAGCAAIFLSNVIIIGMTNQEAVNIAFISSFFISTISMMLPSLLLIIYMFLISPAFIIPAMDENKQKRKTDIIILAIIICIIIYLLYKFIVGIADNYIVKDRYRAKKLPIEYSRNYLKYTNLLPERVKILKNQKMTLPLYYTTDGFRFSGYLEAEDFCNSMNARIPTHLEIYNIIFNRFDTFGEQYYWTSDKAGRHPLVLHFKNMSYEIIMKPKGIHPTLYCVTSADTYKYVIKQNYFHKFPPSNYNKTQNNNNKLPFEFPPKIIKDNFPSIQQIQNQDNINKTLKKESSFVNFNIKHVPRSIFDELLNKGYSYNSLQKANPYYESSENRLDSKVKYDIHNIRLCNFPFTEYKDMSIQNQREIWRQSFCSPSFELINTTPALKTINEKNAYCMANGGRLPNIPELAGIIKTLRISSLNNIYWTNNYVSDYFNEGKKAVAVYYTGNDFIEIKLPEKGIKANTFCIKQSNNPSQIISNYSSRFHGESGKYYAQKRCLNCKYYEMPDTVLIDSYTQ